MIKKNVLFMLIVFFINLFCFSQEMEDELLFFNDDNASLNDVLNKVKLNVATGSTFLTTRESPSIVAIITSAKIKKMGARDLIDVLEMIPGFSFGVDVWGVVGLGVRGNWANEGKVLLLINGQEVNDFAYGSVQLGYHYPVDLIKRIEIIRGPGSVLYGGYAELAVINVITRNYEDLDGIFVSINEGLMEDVEARKNLSIAYGKKVNENFSFSLSCFKGEGIRSDKDFSDFYGDTFDMEDNSDLNPFFTQFDIKYKNLKVNFIADEYRTNTRDSYSFNDPDNIDVDFLSYILNISYELELMDNLKVTPRFHYIRQYPWHSVSDNAEIYNELWDEMISRYAGEFVINYIFNEQINFLIGYEQYVEKAENELSIYKNNTSNEVTYKNQAVYIQGIFRPDFGTFTLGGRYDDHSYSSSAFSPRVAYTKVFDSFHAKFIYGKGFRPPSINNISYYVDVEGIKTKPIPEVSTVYEVEFGYNFFEKVFLSLNFFKMKIDDPIIFYINDDVEDVYSNFPEIGTKGAEVECKIQDTWGYVNLGYSYYDGSDNEVYQYDILDTNYNVIDENATLGFGQHKFTMYSSFRVTDKFSINPSFVYSGKKWAYTAVNEDDVLIAEELDSTFVININWLYENPKNGFDIMLGVMNITDEDILYVQPYYDGYHAPLPGPSREVFIKFFYKL